jgi:hypothetical protein
MIGNTNAENLRFIQNRWIDLDQIVGKETNPLRILLIFQNGDKIELTWRDDAEKQQLLQELAQ